MGHSPSEMPPDEKVPAKCWCKASWISVVMAFLRTSTLSTFCFLRFDFPQQNPRCQIMLRPTLCRTWSTRKNMPWSRTSRNAILATCCCCKVKLNKNILGARPEFLPSADWLVWTAKSKRMKWFEWVQNATDQEWTRFFHLLPAFHIPITCLFDARTLDLLIYSTCTQKFSDTLVTLVWNRCYPIPMPMGKLSHVKITIISSLAWFGVPEPRCHRKALIPKLYRALVIHVAALGCCFWGYPPASNNQPASLVVIYIYISPLLAIIFAYSWLLYWLLTTIHQLPNQPASTSRATY